MRPLIDFIARFRDYFTVVALVIISLSLISLGDTSKIGGYKTFVIGAMGWLQEAFSWVPNPGALKNENRAVRELNVYLSSEVIKGGAAVNENEKLRKMLALKSESEYELEAAEVEGGSVIELRRYITVNKGFAEGLQEGMPVRTDAGLVGIVRVVSKGYSLIETLDNRNMKVSIRTLRSNIEGILSWTGERYFIIRNIPKSYDIKAGDEIVTSSYSSLYPKDIPVGKVIKVQDEPGSLFHKIKVRPFADFRTMEQVFVIKYFVDKGKVDIARRMEERLVARNKGK